ncbi:MAG: hypothetical protein HC905_19665 [Bacteroidales bacterium]|nr:hypothetical protein [Bacteroidales bacterium]
MKIHALVPYRKNSYLIGTANNGLFIYDGRSIVPFPCEVSEFLKYNTCNAGVAMNDSLYVFGTILNGIVEFNANGKIKKTFNFSNGLNNNTVLSLFKDSDQGLWVGLDQGVNYLEVLSPIVQYTNITGTLGTIYTILKKEDQLYIGTNQGLFTARIVNQDEHYSFSEVKMVPGSQGQVWTLREYDNQVLCGHNDGTFLVENGTFRKISPVTGGWVIKPIGKFLIEGNYTGLVLFKKKTVNGPIEIKSKATTNLRGMWKSITLAMYGFRIINVVFTNWNLTKHSTLWLKRNFLEKFPVYQVISMYSILITGLFLPAMSDFIPTITMLEKLSLFRH